MNRWWRLGMAVLAMIMIANLQYAWTLFADPLRSYHHWKLSQVTVAFSAFVACQTWFTPLAGWLIDRMGPRKFLTAGGVACGLGWAGLGRAGTLPHLYLLYAATGMGASFVYCGCMAVALKWFPDKRGLASGICAAGFGSGTALFIPLIAHLLNSSGYRSTLLVTGLAQGLIVVCAAQLLRNPEPHEVQQVATAARPRVRRHDAEFNSFQMLRTPHFYVLYVMMLMSGIGGLMVASQVAPLGHTYGIGKTALAFALSLGPVANGVSRMFWGWASDHMGREYAMVTAFLIQAASLAAVPVFGRTSGLAFIVTLALVFFSWGEIYVLFPAAAADLFGWRNASANFGFIYSTKGVASILVVEAVRLFEKTGSWNAAFFGNAALSLGAAVIAFAFIYMPLPRDPRAGQIEKGQATYAG